MSKKFGIAIALMATFVTTCIKSPTEAPIAVDAMPVTNLKATYIPAKVCLEGETCEPSQDSVMLNWTPPPDLNSFDFYRIYRTSERHVGGELDSSKLMPTYAGRRVDKSVTEFRDIPGLDNDFYLYAVRAVRISSHNVVVQTDYDQADTQVVYDTIYGKLGDQNLVELQVGSDVAFNINKGSIFTATDKCTLVIQDNGDLVESVRFTQNAKTYLVKSNGEKVQVFADDANNPPSAERLEQLVNQGYINEFLKLQAGVTKTVVPDFDALDPLNDASDRTHKLSGGASSFPWTLLQGNGTKKVWAELVYRQGGLVDTVTDNIEIAPWRIQLNFRNKLNSADATMRKKPSENTDYYYIYKPWVKFSVSVFADTTISEDFSYWVLMSEQRAVIDKSFSNAAAGWLETPPVYSRLTGIGPDHDDDKLYTYMLHPDSAAGQENLSEFRHTTATPTRDPDVLVSLATPEGKLNETAVPGSYWGADPKIWRNSNSDPDDYVSTQRLIASDSAQAMYDYLMALDIYQLRSQGKKEFTIVALFKGRYFNDTRVMVAGSKIITDTRFAQNYPPAQSYFDLYPPMIQPAKAGSGCHLTNGDVISSNFCFHLLEGDDKTSVIDLAEANVAEITLVIAKKPTWMDNDEATQLSMDQLFSLRTDLFPYEIKKPENIQRNVGWDNVDPSDWPSGEYLFAVITADEFGNRGLAPYNSNDYTNPFVVTVQSGK